MSLIVPMMAYIRAFFLSRHRLALESVALRQQLAVFKRKQPRPRLNRLDRLFEPHYSAGIQVGADSHSGETRNSGGTMLASVCFGRWKSRPAQRFASHSAVQG